MPYQYSLIVFAVVFGYVFFGDAPQTHTLVGAAIIVASGLYHLPARAARGANNRKRAAAHGSLSRAPDKILARIAMVVAPAFRRAARSEQTQQLEASLQRSYAPWVMQRQ